MEARKIAEREFHNKLRDTHANPHVSDTRWSPELEPTIQSDPMWANMKYYAVERKSREFILDWFKQNCFGKTVLDYCCGNGDDSIQLGQAGAQEVIGIDISDTSIENCTRLAKSNGLDKKLRFLIADAEATGFADNSFDVVNEYGSLHHLDLDKSMAELARILREDGKVICNEALAHNPVIHLYRKLTPHLRTPWEVDHIMRAKDFAKLNRYFGHIEMHFFHLFTLFATPFRNTVIFNPLLSVLEKIDSIVLKLPIVKWFAWQTVFILSKPVKDNAASL